MTFCSYVKKLLILVSLFGFIFLYKWKSTPLYQKYDRVSIHDSIYKSPYHTSHSISSMSSDFFINFTPYSSTKSINPYFPSIHITTNRVHDGWIHIVYTDSKEGSLQKFIDSSLPLDLYPFYTKNSDFYDAPLWSYGLLYKPLSYWTGHAYAIKIIDKKLYPLGGVEWGFRLPLISTYPKFIEIKPLTIDNWKQDSKSFKLGINIDF